MASAQSAAASPSARTGCAQAWIAAKRAAPGRRSLPCTTDWDKEQRGSAARGPRTVRAAVTVRDDGGGTTDRTGQQLSHVDDFE